MNPITTANKLKTLRNFKGMSPEQVAEKAQLNLEDYNALEAGKTEVSIEKLEKACNALGIDYKEWFEKDNSQVYVNNGDIKVDGGSRNIGNCNTCYFYDRNEEDVELLNTLKTLTKSIVQLLNNETFSRNIDKTLQDEKNKSGDKK